VGPESCSVIPCCFVRAKIARSEHSELFKVTDPTRVRGARDTGATHRRHTQATRTRGNPGPLTRHETAARDGTIGRQTPAPVRPMQITASCFRSTSKYELFNLSSVNIRHRSWNYRGCWHQTCPPVGPSTSLYIGPIPIAGPRTGPASLFFVTTSPCREWVICVPAAFLGSGSRFSGSLSGIEP